MFKDIYPLGQMRTPFENASYQWIDQDVREIEHSCSLLTLLSRLRDVYHPSASTDGHIGERGG
jgi:hypothetical protein